MQYGVRVNMTSQNMNVSGDATTQVTVSGLNSATTYSFEVSAVNSAGTGVYSTPTTALTLCKLSRKHPLNLIIINIGFTQNIVLIIQVKKL